MNYTRGRVPQFFLLGRVSGKPFSSFLEYCTDRNTGAAADDEHVSSEYVAVDSQEKAEALDNRGAHEGHADDAGLLPVKILHALNFSSRFKFDTRNLLEIS